MLHNFISLRPTDRFYMLCHLPFCPCFSSSALCLSLKQCTQPISISLLWRVQLMYVTVVPMPLFLQTEKTVCVCGIVPSDREDCMCMCHCSFRQRRLYVCVCGIVPSDREDCMCVCHCPSDREDCSVCVPLFLQTEKTVCVCGHVCHCSFRQRRLYVCVAMCAIVPSDREDCMCVWPCVPLFLQTEKTAVCVWPCVPLFLQTEKTAVGVTMKSTHTRDLETSSPVATLAGAWCYRVTARNGLSGVSTLTGWGCEFDPQLASQCGSTTVSSLDTFVPEIL